MRSIERKYIELAKGYRTIQEHEAKLRSEWADKVNRALKRKYASELAEWKRNTVILYGTGILGVILFVASFRLPAGWSCLFSIFLMPAAMALFLTLGVIKWRWLPQFTSPLRGNLDEVYPLMQQQWWNALHPKLRLSARPGDYGEMEFLSMLSSNLPDAYMAVQQVLTSTRMTTDTDILLIGPTGIWVFEVKHWKGYIIKEHGVWKQAKPYVTRSGDLQYEYAVHETAPDEQWLAQKEEIIKTIGKRLPEQLWVKDFIQGGIVFTHSDAMIDRARINDCKVVYDRPEVWVRRILQTISDDRLTPEVQTKILDVIIEYALLNEKEDVFPVSAVEIADRLYREADQNVSKFVTQWTKKDAGRKK